MAKDVRESKNVKKGNIRKISILRFYIFNFFLFLVNFYVQ